MKTKHEIFVKHLIEAAPKLVSIDQTFDWSCNRVGLGTKSNDFYETRMVGADGQNSNLGLPALK